ncbi:hypothetical protein Cni_G29281 [Canna indica]|uniref:Uncharacterized protein n=1 Tax=Canna indica TaxID=4628 RepID=A0AAQ3QT42_9LILI|nr:hypothetical protein Cni_G29281 [Canna indica]
MRRYCFGVEHRDCRKFPTANSHGSIYGCFFLSRNLMFSPDELEMWTQFLVLAGRLRQLKSDKSKAYMREVELLKLELAIVRRVKSRKIERFVSYCCRIGCSIEGREG